MQFMLMLYIPETPDNAPMPGVPPSAPYLSYTQAMKDASAWTGGARLQPTAAASTVRVRDGRTQVLDGPYAETREQIGGFYLIDAPDLDAALDWAARCPAAGHGVIEVRPLAEI